MAALDVLPLERAKRHLNMQSEVDDGELEDIIGAAVERVERHIGRSLVSGEVTPLQVLACEMVTFEYWRTQRPPGQSRGATYGYSAAAAEADTGPAGVAPLEVRLTDMLGPPAGSAASEDEVPNPVGSFPAPPSPAWPDPAGWC